MDSLSTPLIKLSNVGMRFDDRTILSNINLTVNRGDFIVITGPNGGGKTTLLRIILKLLKPTEGSVEYIGDMRIGYLPQKNSIDSRFPVTVREVVASGLLAEKGLSKEQTNERIEETLRMIDLVDHADKSIGALSGGQLQRTLMGRALISRPTVLVFDEPLSYIDQQFAQKFYAMLAKLASTSTILMVTHDLAGVLPMANRRLIVDRHLAVAPAE